jgi:hypothetical protein
VRPAAARVLLAALLAAVLLGAGTLAAAPAAAQTTSTAAPPDPNALRAPPSLDEPPPGRKLTAEQVRRLADGVPKIRAARAASPGSYSSVFLKGTTRWQVSYYRRAKPLKEIGQVQVDDPSRQGDRGVDGDQVAWTMAAGYPGAFGRKVNAPWVWIPLVRGSSWSLLTLRRVPLGPAGAPELQPAR